MERRRVTGMIGVLIAVSMLVGCGSSGLGTGGSAAQAGAGENTEKESSAGISKDADGVKESAEAAYAEWKGKDQCFGSGDIGTMKSDVEPVRLYLANNLSGSNCTSEAVEWFAKEVEERTGGRIVIEVYHDGSLGDVMSSLEQLQYGAIDIVKADVTAMSNYVGEYNALLMPYIYQDREHFWKVHGGEIGMGILRGKEMTEQKMYGLTYYDGGTRCFYNNKREIHSPADMKGMLVRVQESRVMMSMVEALGAQPMIMPYSEVYSALQPGGVDAADNSIVSYLDQSHYKAAPYFVEDNHTRSADVLVMSELSREKLSEKDLEIIDQAAMESWEYQKELWAEAEEESRLKLLDAGVTITELSEEELDVFRSVCEPIWYDYENGIYNDLIDRIVAAGK